MRKKGATAVSLPQIQSGVMWQARPRLTAKNAKFMDVFDKKKKKKTPTLLVLYILLKNFCTGKTKVLAMSQLRDRFEISTTKISNGLTVKIYYHPYAVLSSYLQAMSSL